MGSNHICSFGFACDKTKDELMKLGDEVIERLILSSTGLRLWHIGCKGYVVNTLYTGIEHQSDGCDLEKSLHCMHAIHIYIYIYVYIYIYM